MRSSKAVFQSLMFMECLFDLNCGIKWRKYKRQELSFKKQIDEMRVDHEESAKRVRYIEDENKKIVS